MSGAVHRTAPIIIELLYILGSNVAICMGDESDEYESIYV